MFVEMLPPGHYSSVAPMRSPMTPQGTGPPYAYGQQQQPMPAAPTQSSYNMPQSSPHFQMASNHPSQNASLEQLEKVSVLCLAVVVDITADMPCCSGGRYCRYALL